MRIYRVEAKRLADEIAETGSYELEKYPHITGVFTDDDGKLYISDEHYLIIEAGGMLYRVEYTAGNGQHSIAAVNGVLGALFLLMIGLLYYIRGHIIVPFFSTAVSKRNTVITTIHSLLKALIQTYTPHPRQ